MQIEQLEHELSRVEPTSKRATSAQMQINFIRSEFSNLGMGDDPSPDWQVPGFINRAFSYYLRIDFVRESEIRQAGQTECQIRAQYLTLHTLNLTLAFPLDLKIITFVRQDKYRVKSWVSNLLLPKLYAGELTIAQLEIVSRLWKNFSAGEVGKFLAVQDYFLAQEKFLQWCKLIDSSSAQDLADLAEIIKNPCFSATQLAQFLDQAWQASLQHYQGLATGLGFIVELGLIVAAAVFLSLLIPGFGLAVSLLVGGYLGLLVASNQRVINFSKQLGEKIFQAIAPKQKIIQRAATALHALPNSSLPSRQARRAKFSLR